MAFAVTCSFASSNAFFLLQLLAPTSFVASADAASLRFAAFFFAASAAFSAASFAFLAFSTNPPIFASIAAVFAAAAFAAAAASIAAIAPSRCVFRFPSTLSTHTSKRRHRASTMNSSTFSRHLRNASFRTSFRSLRTAAAGLHMFSRS